ncbi:MAG: stage III sporulation protein AF [Clostridiales bacterium]|nr:stage III sporulation protein AF [Clostridiales bacterium]
MDRKKVDKRKRIVLNKWLIVLLIVIISALLRAEVATARGPVNNNIDYDGIQDVIDDILSHETEFDFNEYVERLVSGQESFSLSDIGEKLIKSIKSEIKGNINIFGKLIAIAVLAAIFTNFSMAFKNNQVSETGYYVTHLLLQGLLMSSFVSASQVASRAIGSLLDFMKVLVPAYFISVGFCSGSTTSLVYYEASLFLITAADYILIKVIIPLINFYLVIALINNISKEDMLSKLAGVISTIVDWGLKSLLAAVIGFNGIQGLIVPVADRIKKSALLKASEAIPGVGNAIGGVAETMLGAGYLLKNAIGVAGLVMIITICAIPIIKLVVVNLIYRFGCAALQPISDKRVIECVSASAKSSGLLLQTVFTGAVLFMLTITIVAVSTGG